MEIVNTIGKNDTQMLAKLSELLGSSLYREDIIAPSFRKFDLATQLEPTAKTCVGKKSFKKIIYSGVKNSLLRDTSVTVAGAAEGDDRDCSNSSRAISFKSWQSKVTVAGSKSSSSAANNAAVSLDTARCIAGPTPNFGGTTQVSHYLQSSYCELYSGYRMRPRLLC